MGFNTFPCNPYPISTEELNKGNNDDLNTRVTALESDVSDLNSNKANQITIAPFFNAETAYTAGDLVYYNGLSYRCTNDHEGAWDADDFAATTIAGELDSLKNGLTNVAKKLELRNLDISVPANSYSVYDLSENVDFVALINAGYTPISAMSYDSLALHATTHYYATQSKWFVVVYNAYTDEQTANSVDMYFAKIGT